MLPAISGMTNKLSQQFCIFLDGAGGGDAPLETTPQGAEYLVLTSYERFVLDGGQLSRAENGPAAVHMETIRNKSGTILLMAVAPHLPVTVNGLPAARVSVLNAGDVVGIGDHVFHISLLNRPYYGPPDDDQLGVPCSYCRLAIKNEPHMRIYLCPACQRPMHAHGDEVPADDRLECATMSTRCAYCDAQIVQTEGFTYVPEL